MYCPECGSKNIDNAKYCKNCGETLNLKKVAQNTPGICPYCAEEISPNAVKCKHCGEWLNKSADIASKKENHSGAIILGWIFTIFGGWIGLIIGIYLATRNDERAHKHGVAIIVISIIWALIIFFAYVSWMNSINSYQYYY